MCISSGLISTFKENVGWYEKNLREEQAVNQSASTSFNIRILLADMHAIICQGIRQEIETQSDMLVVGETNDGFELLDLATELKPDVIILDIKLARLSGLKVIRCLNKMNWRVPDSLPKIVVYSTHSDKQYVWSLLAAGAKGYLLKSDPPEKLLAAIRLVKSGQIVLSQTVQTNLVKMIPHLNQDLSNGEIKVMQLLAQGQSNQEIAKNLNISVGTVKSHLNNTYRKIPWIRSRAEAVAWAWINHIVSEKK